MTTEISQKKNLGEVLSSLQNAISQVYRGHQENIEFVLTALLAGGHILLEDIPGVGKTTLARTLSKVCGCDYRRLQGTPDLLPSDITGVSIYDEDSKTFNFHKGPIFCDILLADELNRTPPRTQSALLEAMSEGQVSVEGRTYSMSSTFFCIATQNPYENTGIYPLPDSQRDRFLLSIKLGYPEPESELAMLRDGGVRQNLEELNAVINKKILHQLRQETAKIQFEESVLQYLFDIISATRHHKQLQVGASPRAALSFQKACQAYALLQGRRFVIPDDIQHLAVPSLAHRLISRSKSDPHTLLETLIHEIDVPR